MLSGNQGINAVN